MRLWFPGPGALALALLTCVLLPAMLIAIHVHVNYQFSPQDEPIEYDYVNRMAEGSVPRLGQMVLPSTLRVLACHGVALQGMSFPPCDSATFQPSVFGANAYQYEAQQPPAYYAVTAGLRWIPQRLLGVSLLSATRLTGILWLAAGLLLLWGAGRLLEVGVLPLGIGTLLLGTSPTVLYNSSIVDNSASGVFAGSLLLFLAALAWRRPRRWSLPALALAAVVACSLDLTNSLGVLALAVLFMGLAALEPGTAAATARRLARAAASPWSRRALAMVLGGIVAVAGWYVAYRHLRLYDLQARPSLGLLHEYGRPPFSLFVKQAVSLLQPLTQTPTGAAYRATATGAVAGPPLSQNLQSVMSTLLELLVVAGGLTWLFVRPRLWPQWCGLVALPTLYLGGLAIGLLEWHLLSTYPGLVGRYGLAVAPLLILALIGSLRGRGAQAAVGAFAVAQAGLGFYFLLA